MEGEGEFNYIEATEPPKDCLELSLVERPTQAFYGLIFRERTYVPLDCKTQNAISEAISQFQRIIFSVTAEMFINTERHCLVYKTGERTGVEYPIVALPGRGMLDNIYIVTDQTAFTLSKGFYAMLTEANGPTKMIDDMKEDKNYGVEWAYATQKDILSVTVNDELTEAINANGGMKAFADKSSLKLKGVEWMLEQEGSQFYLVDGSFRKRVLPIPSLWLFTNDENKLEAFTPDASRHLEHCYRNGTLSTKIEVKEKSYVVNMLTEPFFEIRHPYFFLRRKVVRIGLPLSRKHSEFLKLARNFQTLQTQVPWKWELPANLDSEPKEPIYTLDPEKDKTEYKQVLEFIHHERKIPEAGIAFRNSGFENSSPNKRPRSEQSQSKPEYEIVNIRRLMNPVVFSRFREYANKVASFWGGYLEQGAPSKYLRKFSDCDSLYDVRTNEYYMWHGGGKVETDAILRTQCFQLEEQPDFPFGRGVYFSESFTESLKYCRCMQCNGSLLTPPLNRSRQCLCEKREEEPVHTVFLCRTVLGNPLIVRDADQFSLHKPQVPKPSLRSSARRAIFDGLGEQSPLPSFGVTMNVLIVYDKDERSSSNQADDIEHTLLYNRYRPTRVDIDTMDTTSHTLSNAVVHFCMRGSQKIEVLKKKLEVCAATDSFYFWVPNGDTSVVEAVNEAIENSREKGEQVPTDQPLFHKQMHYQLECNDTQSADSTFVEDQYSGMPLHVSSKKLMSMIASSGRELARSPFKEGKFSHRAFVVYNTAASYPFYAVDYRLKHTDTTSEPSPK